MKSNQSARRLHQFLSILAATLLAVTLETANGHAQEPRDSWDFGWVDEFANPNHGAAVYGVAVDPTAVYVAGETFGALPGQISSSIEGVPDAYVRRYDFDGDVVWTRQFGTPGATTTDEAFGVVTDPTGIYVTGNTAGAFPGQTNSGFFDVFVRKYDVNGDVLWTTQFGTSHSDVVFVHPIATHSSGLYVVGFTYGTFPGEPAGSGRDIFLAHLDPTTGHIVWIHQFGIRDHAGDLRLGGVKADDTGIYVTATLQPNGIPDKVSQSPPGTELAVLRKYNLDGNLLWSRELSNGPGCFATFWDVGVRAGTAYVIGQWDESYLNDPQRCTPSEPGSTQVGVLQAYDSDGDLRWTRRIKAGADSKFTGAKNVSVSDQGIFVSANVVGSFAGHLPSGPKSDHCSALRFGGNSFFNSLDAYVRRYDFDGNVVWTHQFGSPVFDIIDSTAADSTSVYAGGYTLCRVASEVTFSSDNAAFAVRMALNPTSPSGLIQLVIGRLETLNDKGRFTPGQFSSLVNSLEAALSAIDRGDASGAKQLMQTFIEKVETQRDAGTISSAEAAPLIDGANSVIAAL